MRKPAKNTTKKLGRSEAIGSDQLLERCKLFKWFLEENWGRIGLELRNVRDPSDVVRALRIVPGVERLRPFSDEPSKCLIQEGGVNANSRERSLASKQREEAINDERRLFLEYQAAHQKAGETGAALNAFISQLGPVIGLLPFILAVAVIAKSLRTEELATNAAMLEKSYRLAQQSKEALYKRLLCQSAWYSQNEVIKFVRSTRYEKSPINFAKVMAGLPEYSWIYSLRKCSEIEGSSLCSLSPNYRLFQLIAAVVKKLKPMNFFKLNTMLMDELRKNEFREVKQRVGPNWAYMQQALTHCRGKRLKRSEIPYRLVSEFLRNVERPKTTTEIELAKREELH